MKEELNEAKRPVTECCGAEIDVMDNASPLICKTCLRHVHADGTLVPGTGLGYSLKQTP